jgi:hypothetical protein
MNTLHIQFSRKYYINLHVHWYIFSNKKKNEWSNSIEITFSIDIEAKGKKCNGCKNKEKKVFPMKINSGDMSSKQMIDWFKRKIQLNFLSRNSSQIKDFYDDGKCFFFFSISLKIIFIKYLIQNDKRQMCDLFLCTTKYVFVQSV